VGSGQHFAFMNQPGAGLANFGTLVESVASFLGEKSRQVVSQMQNLAEEKMNAAVADTWRKKMGFEASSIGSSSAATLWKGLEPLMRSSSVDYTIFWRQLGAVMVVQEARYSGETRLDPTPGAAVRIVELVSATELNGTVGTCMHLVAESGRWGVALDSGGEKALKTGNLEVLSSGSELFAQLEEAFYTPPGERHRSAWLLWLRRWRAVLLADTTGDDRQAARARMNHANPKYIPREWMLIQAYDAANMGNYGFVHELYSLFCSPYDEHPELAQKYFRRTPAEYQQMGGCEVMT